MPSAAVAETASPPSTPFHNRRALHVPFFPVNTPPPLQSPSYPSSNPQPFFPQFSSPPPPPAAASSTSSTQSSFPSSVSSLTFPNSRPAPPGHHSSKLLPAVLLPLLAVALLALSLAAFVAHRRRRRRLQSEYKFDARSDSLRLFPSRAAASDGGVATRKHPSPLAAAVPTEFFGALVSSRRRTSGSDDEDDPGALDSASESPYQKLSSPDLRPLPPLTRQYRQGRGNADAGGGGSSDEEFYSPRGSSIEKATVGDLASERLSSSRRIMFLPVAVEKCGSRSSTLSTPSYPSSNTTSSPSRLSPAASSPHVEPSSGHSSGRSLKSLSEGSLLGSLKFAAPPPTRSPPSPPPLAPMRPLTPSPPKRKPPSPSPPSSPQEKESDPKVENSDFSCSPSPGPPQRKAPLPPPPPPPPPPPGYWERRMGKIREIQQQIVSPEKPVEERNLSTLVYPEDLTQNTEAVEKNEETPRPKLKPLHWDKVRARSDRATVWDQLKTSSFQVNEEMIQTLFVCNTTSTAPEETKKRPVLPSPRQENRVLDPKKSQNIAILLRALNVTKEEVCEALLDGNADSLGTELLETLLKMAPTKEEEIKLKEWKDESEVKLGTAEKFLKALLDIPFAFKRVDAMLYIANFDSEVNYLKKSFETLEAACEELRSSRLFLKLLEAVLKTGNHMNVGTNRGDAHAFKLDTLLKLVDVKGTDGKTTLLHFVVQEIIRDEGSRLSADRTQGKTMRDDLECKKLTLKVVAGLGNELSNVKKAAAMDADVLSSYVSKLAGGIGKISEVVKLNEALASQENVQSFHNSMSAFLKVAEDNIIQVQAQESVSLSLVKEITEYFHGNSAKEEAHPFRIFMVVRDFLTILDQVCKEVGRINYHTIVSSGQHFPVPVNPTLLPVFPRHHALRTRSSDEDSF